MPRLKWALAVLAALLLPAAFAAPAGAHVTVPDYRSVVNQLAPHLPGLTVRVLGFDDQFELTNRTKKEVVVYGYLKEPYARLLPDGTVQVNDRSPAKYLNEDRYGTTPIPKFANANAKPQWQTIDRVGRFVWHDHRMHWMAHTIPKQVKDKSKKTKIFDYKIPMTVGGAPGGISGTLYWIGGGSSSFPTGAIVALVALVLLAIALVVFVRRRRRGDPDRDALDKTPPPPATKEAW